MFSSIVGQETNGFGGCSLTIGDPTRKTPAHPTVQVLVGDSRRVLQQMEPGIVQCCSIDHLFLTMQ